jgi:hypothetical protein
MRAPADWTPSLSAYALWLDDLDLDASMKLAGSMLFVMVPKLLDAGYRDAAYTLAMVAESSVHEMAQLKPGRAAGEGLLAPHWST